MSAANAFESVTNMLSLNPNYSRRPLGLSWRSSTLFICFTIGMALYTDLFLYALIVPVFPFMLRERVHVPQDKIQEWVSNLLAIYAGSMVCFSPIAGVLADTVSTRQAPFLLGLTALIASTVLLAVGETIPVLAIARVLQGISGSVVWTVGLAMCLETVGPANLGKTIGTFFSIISVGMVGAPALGGILYRKTGYIGVFSVGISLLVIDLILRLLVIEKKTAARYKSNTDDPQTNPQTTPSDGAAEAQAANGEDESAPLLSNKPPEYSAYKLSPDQPAWVHKIPIIPCLKDPALLTALFISFVQAFYLAGFDATVPLVAEAYFGFDSMQAGILFLALGATEFVIGPLAGWAVDVFGTKPVSTLGYAMLVPAHILLRLPHPGGRDQIIIYSLVLALCGAGSAVVSSPSIVEAGAVVERYHKANPDLFGENGPYAQLYGLSSAVFSAGLTLGPLCAGGLRESIGYGNMNAVMAGICGVSAVLCYAYIGGDPRWWKKRTPA